MPEPCSKRPLTKEEAQDGLYNVRHKRREYGSENRAETRSYWCDTCQAFHLTSQQKPPQNTMTAYRKPKYPLNISLPNGKDRDIHPQLPLSD